MPSQKKTVNILTPARLVAMLGKVPEKKLRIFSLAPQLLTPEGSVDIEKCLDRHGEILPAIEEVRSYIRDCQAARWNLVNIDRRKFDLHQYEEEDIEVAEDEDE